MVKVNGNVLRWIVSVANLFFKQDEFMTRLREIRLSNLFCTLKVCQTVGCLNACALRGSRGDLLIETFSFEAKGDI